MLRAGAPTQLSKGFGGCAGRGASCSCPGSALPALLASCCRVVVAPRKQRVELEGAKTQTQCALWQASRANISLLAAPCSIKHPGGCFWAPRLGAGSPHPSWSQDASWAGGELLGGDGEPTCKELVYSWLLKLHGMRRGGHTGQSPGGSIHASKEFGATAAQGSRLHRQPPSIPHAHFMPTHPIINYCRK